MDPQQLKLLIQGDDLQEAHRKGWISDHMLQQIDLSMVELLDVQGGKERIKKTPKSALFTCFSTRLVFVYSILMAIGLVKAPNWWTIPIVMMVGFIFRIIDTAGRLIENPFSTFYYGLPLNAISRTIERNLCDRIGRETRPPIAAEDGVLM